MTGTEAVAAALIQHGWYVDVGAGHNWEKKLAETGIPAEQIAEALKAEDFDLGDCRTPVLAITKAADYVRVAAAAEKAREPVYDWQGGAITEKPRGHGCERDATCSERYAFRVKTADGKPVLLCCWHYRPEAPRRAVEAWEKRVAPEREATKRWAEELARAFERMPKLPQPKTADVEALEEVAA